MTLVNGQVRQDWSTNDMIFNCRQLISFASKVMTIRPGDIFYTGTPQGVIFGVFNDAAVAGSDTTSSTRARISSIFSSSLSS